MTHPAGRLLGGHAFSTLTQAEKDELYRAALDDQELFDAIADEEPLRELLSDPAGRRSLLQLLERPTLGERVRAFFGQPATLAHLSAATAALFVSFAAWVLLGPASHPPRPLAADPPSAAAPSPLHEAVFALPVDEADGVRVSGRPPSFALAVAEPSRALVLEKTPNGRVRQLFPAPGTGSRLWPPGLLSVTGGREPGVHRVRFLVAPPDLEPLSLDARALQAAASRVVVVERVYEGTAN